MKTKILLPAAFSFFIFNFALTASAAFEGHVRATLTRGGEVETYLYTIGTNCLRVARGETNWPYTVNLVNRDSGAVTLLFANNRSFVNLPNSGTGILPVSSNGGQDSANAQDRKSVV